MSFEAFTNVWNIIGDYMIAAALGAVISSGEIIARYRDEPWDTLRSFPAMFYMLINALASMAALTIVRTFGMSFGASETNTPLIQVIVAGLGAMMIFRSAFFTMRVNNEDVAVGAASFLQVMLAAVDREVDRRRATLRAGRVQRIMGAVAFDKALTALPTYCIALMQNLDEDDQKQLLEDLKVLANSPNLEPAIKAQILGLAVMNKLGEDVLQASVEALGVDILNPNAIRQSPLDLAPAPNSAVGKFISRIRGDKPVETPAPAAGASPVGMGAAGLPTTTLPAAPVSPAEIPVDIARVLSKVRENTSPPAASPLPAEPDPPVESNTTVSLPLDAPVH